MRARGPQPEEDAEESEGGSEGKDHGNDIEDHVNDIETMSESVEPEGDKNHNVGGADLNKNETEDKNQTDDKNQAENSKTKDTKDANGSPQNSDMRHREGHSAGPGKHGMSAMELYFGRHTDFEIGERPTDFEIGERDRGEGESGEGESGEGGDAETGETAASSSPISAEIGEAEDVSEDYYTRSTFGRVN
jgi:hypothetical protein